MDIKERANRLAKIYKTRDPFEVIRGLNIILIMCPLVGVKGFYQHFQRNNINYIDEKLPRNDKIFVCAHELGHMFLHKKANAIFMDTMTHFNTRKYEYEADKFAMEFLVSDDMIMELCCEKAYTIDMLERLLGYKKELIRLRIDNSYN